MTPCWYCLDEPEQQPCEACDDRGPLLDVLAVAREVAAELLVRGDHGISADIEERLVLVLAKVADR